MNALKLRWLVVSLAAGLLVPGLATAQGLPAGAVGSAGTTSGIMGVTAPSGISGSTLQNANTRTGNAAATGVQGLSGGNVNANLNTNQNTTGVNLGTQVGEGASYDGTTNFASPDQYIGFGDSTSVNLLQVPGFLGVPSNFSQPYKPDLWVNGPGPIVPSTLTLSQAEECRASGVKSDWDGGERPPVDTIELVWPTLGQQFPRLSSPTSYVGTSKASATEKYSFMATVCQAAYEAMKRGVTKGIVTFVIRPKNQAAGIGFGGTSGGSGLPSGVTATHPYALAGALGFGTGFSRAYIEGELLMHVVGLRESAKAEPAKTNGHPTASIPSQVAAEKLRDEPERSRLGASDTRWFGAPRPRAQGDTTTGNGSSTDKSWFGAARRLGPEADATTQRESLSAMSGPAQHVAENPQDESDPPARAPAAEKAWFGASNGMSR